MNLNLFRIKSLMAKEWDGDGRNLYLVLADVCAG